MLVKAFVLKLRFRTMIGTMWLIPISARPAGIASRTVPRVPSTTGERCPLRGSTAFKSNSAGLPCRQNGVPCNWLPRASVPKWPLRTAHHNLPLHRRVMPHLMPGWVPPCLPGRPRIPSRTCTVRATLLPPPSRATCASPNWGRNTTRTRSCWTWAVHPSPCWRASPSASLPPALTPRASRTMPASIPSRASCLGTWGERQRIHREDRSKQDRLRGEETDQEATCEDAAAGAVRPQADGNAEGCQEQPRHNVGHPQRHRVGRAGLREFAHGVAHVRVAWGEQASHDHVGHVHQRTQRAAEEQGPPQAQGAGLDEGERSSRFLRRHGSVHLSCEQGEQQIHDECFGVTGGAKS